MSFFPKIHECVIFISIFGQILNILADYGRSDKNICYSGAIAFATYQNYAKKERKGTNPPVRRC